MNIMVQMTCASHLPVELLHQIFAQILGASLVEVCTSPQPPTWAFTSFESLCTSSKLFRAIARRLVCPSRTEHPSILGSKESICPGTGSRNATPDHRIAASACGSVEAVRVYCPFRQYLEALHLLAAHPCRDHPIVRLTTRLVPDNDASDISTLYRVCQSLVQVSALRRSSSGTNTVERGVKLCLKRLDAMTALCDKATPSELMEPLRRAISNEKTLTTFGLAFSTSTRLYELSQNNEVVSNDVAALQAVTTEIHDLLLRAEKLGDRAPLAWYKAYFATPAATLTEMDQLSQFTAALEGVADLKLDLDEYDICDRSRALRTLWSPIQTLISAEKPFSGKANITECRCLTTTSAMNDDEPL